MVSAQDPDFILKEYETIVETIKEVTKGSIKVTTDELKSPEAEKIASVYIGLACAIMHISAETIVQAELQALEELMYPGILDDSIALMNTAIILNRLLAACCIHDFSSRDIISPKPKRTHRMLSALVNFLQFQFSREHVPNEAGEKAQRMKQKTDAMFQKRDELQRRIEIIRGRKAQEYEELKKVNPIVDSLRTTHDKLNRQQEHDGKVLENIKAESKFKSDLVDISKREREIKSCEEIIHNKKASLIQWNLSDIELKQLEEDSHVALKMTTNLKQILERERVGESTLEKLKDRVLSQEQIFKDLTATLQNKRRQANSKYEKMHRLGLKHDKKISSMVKTMEIGTMKRANMEKDIKENVEVRRLQLIKEEEELLEMDQIQAQIHQQRIEKVQFNYEQILGQLDVYHRSLAKGWQEISPYYETE